MARKIHQGLRRRSNRFWRRLRSRQGRGRFFLLQRNHRRTTAGRRMVRDAAVAEWIDRRSGSASADALPGRTVALAVGAFPLLADVGEAGARVEATEGLLQIRLVELTDGLLVKLEALLLSLLLLHWYPPWGIRYIGKSLRPEHGDVDIL